MPEKHDDTTIAAIEKIIDGFRKQWSRLWIPGAALIILIVSTRSCVTIEPGQVAVRINNITGAQTTLTQPGLAMRLPFGIHSIRILDASTQTFVMTGAQNINDLHVKELTVRSRDGSNFSFKDTKVTFRVLGPEAQAVLSNTGAGSNFKHWMRPFTRSILRDEFGKESTISVSNMATLGVATRRATERMNEALNKHGIEVTEIVTPRPSFADQYEELIEARNEAENQLKVIDSELTRAVTERQRRLAEVNRDQNRIIQEKRAEYEAALATAVTQKAEITRTVDTLRIEKVGQGQAALSAAARQAEELRGELAAVYESRKAEIDAFRNQPVERVMERLGERLEGITIDIQPWADDSTPSRLRIEQAGGAR